MFHCIKEGHSIEIGIFERQSAVFDTLETGASLFVDCSKSSLGSFDCFVADVYSVSSEFERSL